MFTQLLFPQRCVHCKKRFGSYLCNECFARISFCTQQYCPSITCGKPSLHGIAHTRCERTSALDGHIAITNYDATMKSLLEHYKRRGVYKLEPILARAIAQFLSGELEEPVWGTSTNSQIVVSCVPLYWIDARFRNYNIAQRIAQMVADVFGYEVDFSLIKKNRPTLPQKDLTREKRLRNLIDAFEVDNSSYIPQNVLLVDDVWTTGATLHACAKACKTAGVGFVWGITLARGL